MPHILIDLWAATMELALILNSSDVHQGIRQRNARKSPELALIHDSTFTTPYYVADCPRS